MEKEYLQQNKINKEIECNCEKIEELNKKIRLIKANSFDKRIEKFLTFSMIPWAVTMFLLPLIIIKFSIVPLVSLIQPLSVCVPVLIAVAGENYYQKKYKYKERLKSFSIARTERERIEESTKYEIENQKLIEHNEILKYISEKIKSNKTMIESLSSNYDISEKGDTILSKNEIIDNIKNVEVELSKQYQILNNTVTKKILVSKFRNTKRKFKIMDILMTSSYCAVGLLCFSMLPSFVVSFFVSNYSIGVLPVFISYILGGVIGSVYSIKNIRDKTKAFQNLNREFGENSLCNDNDFEKNDFDFDSKIKDVIKNILKYQEQKQLLENRIDFENTKDELQTTTDENKVNKHLFDRVEFIIEEKGPKLFKKR